MIGATILRPAWDGGKRETGVNPVRSRHCDWGEDASAYAQPLSNREGGICSMTHQPGNLPLIGTGTGNCPDHEELVVLKAAAQAVFCCAF